MEFVNVKARSYLIIDENGGKLATVTTHWEMASRWATYDGRIRPKWGMTKKGWKVVWVGRRKSEIFPTLKSIGDKYEFTNFPGHGKLLQ